MQHPDEGNIHAWLDGALSPGDSAEVEAHVQSCAQCAAAVAEARGFIAGASRILTALDNVPSGVVPVANPRKSRNWPVWRAAAAVLVVALGSFVVLRERVGDTDQPTPDLSSAHAVISQTTTAQTLSAPAPSVPEKTQAQADRAVAPPRVVTASPRGGAAVGALDNATVVREQKSASANVVAMDAVSSNPLPRAVGRRPAIGASSTLYEVSPGDTVLLAEATETQLNAVVVTGLGAAAPVPAASGARAMSKSAQPDTQRRVAVAQPNAQAITQSGAQESAKFAAPATALRSPVNAAAAAAAMAGVANPYNTITWVDSASGKRMSLSGRHSIQELEEIRQKIERVRAAESAEKKSP